jgi:hypothetical protein
MSSNTAMAVLAIAFCSMIGFMAHEDTVEKLAKIEACTKIAIAQGASSPSSSVHCTLQ